MSEIFALELRERRLSEEVLAPLQLALFSPSPTGGGSPSRVMTLFLRSCATISRINVALYPNGDWTRWVHTDRLLEVAANVFVEDGLPIEDANDLAKRALAAARERNLLQFAEDDEWRPGIPSGAGWVEKASLTRMGTRLLGHH